MKKCKTVEKKKTETLVLFSKATLSSWGASLADLGICTLLAATGINYILATFIGAVSGGILNCIVNYRWVFHAEGCSWTKVAFRYLLVWTGSIGWNTGLTWLLTEWTGHFLISRIGVAIAVAIFWNFLLQRNFVYRPSRSLTNLSSDDNAPKKSFTGSDDNNDSSGKNFTGSDDDDDSSGKNFTGSDDDDESQRNRIDEK